MVGDSVAQILLGVIGTLATLFGVWVAWRVGGGRVTSNHDHKYFVLRTRQANADIGVAGRKYFQRIAINRQDPRYDIVSAKQNGC
jgi:hypothetical protein